MCEIRAPAVRPAITADMDIQQLEDAAWPGTAGFGISLPRAGVKQAAVPSSQAWLPQDTGALCKVTLFAAMDW